MAFDSSWMRRLPHPEMPQGGAPYPRRWPALMVISMGIFLIAFDITIVGIVAPSLTRALGASATDIQWTFDAFTVVMGGFVVLGSGLAERFGRRRFVQIGLLVFAIGSLLAGFAPNVATLIAGRIIAGFGAAVVFPACLSIISVLFPPAEKSRAIAIFASISAAGMACGPVIGGILIEAFWWGAPFVFVVPIALAAMVGLQILVPPSRKAGEEPLDAIGALLSVVGLGGIVFSVIEGPARGWTEPLVVGTLIVGLLATASFIAWELRTPAPLFDLRVFREPAVVGGALAMGTVYFTFNSSQMLLPQYFVDVLNYSSLQAGFLMLPFGAALALLSPRSPALIERFGQRAMLVFSLVSMAAGMGVLALIPIWGGIANVLVGASIFGVGFGLIVAPATSAIMVALPDQKAGDGSAVNMVSRQIGGAIGVAVAGSIAAAVYQSGLNLSEFLLTPEQARAVRLSLSGVVALRDQIDPVMAQRLDAMADASMARGLGVALATSGLVTAAVAVIGFFSLRPRKPRP